MHDDHVDGFAVPVVQAIAAPRLLLLCGVPQTFFIANFLAAALLLATGSMLGGALWWRPVLGNLALHGIAMVGTAYEEQWLEMAWRYLRYGALYEG